MVSQDPTMHALTSIFRDRIPDLAYEMAVFPSMEKAERCLDASRADA